VKVGKILIAAAVSATVVTASDGLENWQRTILSLVTIYFTIFILNILQKWRDKR
jgi:cadmium resistance protein CadD (predicted permease)